MIVSKLAELGLKDLRKAADLIEDHISWMEAQNHSPGYIDSTLTAIKSWLRHFDIEIKRNIKIRYSDRTPTLEGERVPNQEYFTFLTENGVQKLLTYLNDRLARGETLRPDSPLIAPDIDYKTYRGSNTDKKFLPTSKVTQDIRDSFRPRFAW